MRMRLVGLSLAVVVFGWGCGGGDSSPDQGGDVGSGEGIAPADAGPQPERPTPSDTLAPPDGPCDPAVLGRPCTQSDQCGDGASCLVTSGTDGVCTCQCSPDDPLSKSTNEDSCPGEGDNICGAVSLSNGQTLNLCFQTCQPTLGKNTCQAPLACRPRASSVVGGASAVCVVTGCEADSDCPVTVKNAEGTDSKRCDTSQADSCDASAGEACLPLTSSGTQGVCTTAGTCDKPSGLCGGKKAGSFKADAKVGDPCKADVDCGELMSCEMELDRKGVLGQKDHGAACAADADCCGSCDPGTTKCVGACTVHARNGYCLLSGCAFATESAWKEFACPDGSVCNKIFSGGICMKACDLNDAASCRGNDADQHGDYECRGWNNISAGADTVADGPACDFGDFVACNIFEVSGSTLTCSALGLPGNPPSEPANPTDMACRDIVTGDKKPGERDKDGFCLDNTASGDKPVTP